MPNHVIQVHSVVPVALGLPTDLAQVVAPIQFNLVDQATWKPGTGAGAVSAEWSGVVSLAASTFDLDLKTLTRAVDSAAVVFSAVRLLAVAASPTNAGPITLAAAGATNPWTALLGGPLVLPAGSVAVLKNATATAWPVASGSKVLRIGGTVGDSVQLYLAGE